MTQTFQMVTVGGQATVNRQVCTESDLSIALGNYVAWGGHEPREDTGIAFLLLKMPLAHAAVRRGLGVGPPPTVQTAVPWEAAGGERWGVSPGGPERPRN
ncbi:hypothetical protein JCM3263A_27550 [Thermobifida fusca]